MTWTGAQSGRPAPAPASGQREASSSSLSGLERLLPRPEDDQPEKKKKLLFKEPTHEEPQPRTLTWRLLPADEKLEGGSFALRVRSGAGPGKPEVYWGLAEAQHHLGDFASAKANYLKLLDYDPDGPHASRRARN